MNAKIKWLRNQLETLKLDGMVVSNPVNVKYLTGLDEEGLLIIAPRENIFITDARYIENVNKKLTISDEIVACDTRDINKYDYENFFILCNNVGFEEKYVTYEAYQKYLQSFQVNLVETEGIIENQRIVKDEYELECIKKACEITDKAYLYAINHIREGCTEKELAFEIDRYMVMHGADGPAFQTIVASGKNTSVPHAIPTNKKIMPGDIVQFDMGAKYNGYMADMSRVIFMEEIADDDYIEKYNFVLEQQSKITDKIKDGTNIKTVIKDIDSEFKFKKYEILHAFGHGVGLAIHENPVLTARQDNIIKENTVIAVEPGVYFQGKYGIRIEDTYNVTKNSCEPLTNSDKEIRIINFKV